MKTSTKIVLGSVLALGVAGGGVAAYKGHGWGHHDGERMIGRVSEELSLTPEQSETLRALRDQVLQIRTEMRAQHDSPRQVLLALIEGPVLDEAGALELVTAKTRAVEQRAPEVIASLAAFYNGLSAEQQATVRERIGSHLHGRWHE